MKYLSYVHNIGNFIIMTVRQEESNTKIKLKMRLKSQ